MLWTVQAIEFDGASVTQGYATRWLKYHGLKPLGPIPVMNGVNLVYALLPRRWFCRFGVMHLSKDVRAIIGYHVGPIRLFRYDPIARFGKDQLLSRQKNIPQGVWA